MGRFPPGEHNLQTGGCTPWSKRIAAIFTASVAEKRRWLKGTTWDGELGLPARMVLKELLEHSLEADIEHQLGGVSHYQRPEDRRDCRNSYHTHDVVTEHGTIRLAARARPKGHATWRACIAVACVTTGFGW